MPRLDRPTVRAFSDACFEPRRPAVLTNCLAHWPALTKWRDLRYVAHVAGDRVVPVERGAPARAGRLRENIRRTGRVPSKDLPRLVAGGAHYLDDRWTEALMPLRTFLDEHVFRGDASSYLAQHQLFDQIPRLRRDVGTPDYCCLGDAMPTLNAWLGPAGTKSPLHFDRYHNLLCQVFSAARQSATCRSGRLEIRQSFAETFRSAPAPRRRARKRLGTAQAVGSKYVRLYAPSQSDALYPRSSEDVHAVSSRIVDVDSASEFPLFSDAPYVDVVLRAGEMLYIPPKWWHYIESQEPSFSVSFWWAPSVGDSSAG